MVPAVVSGFVAALLAPLLVCRLPRQAGWLLALIPASLTLYFVQLMWQVAAGVIPRSQHNWVTALKVEFSLRADGLSALMAILISGVGTVVVVYAGGYLRGHPALGRFYAWLFIFMASMLGVVLADNLLVLFVFWELTSFSSFMLIGFAHDDEAARTAALQALVVTGAGGLVMLAGFLLLGMVGGTLEISALRAPSTGLVASPKYTAALVLIAIGAFTKSAQFPFHFWLPNAMRAPTPVSAYLHSATMVKAGVYLLARLSPVLAGGPLWAPLVGSVGAVTMVIGALLALPQTDLKRLLAYSTVSALGLLTLLIGLGGKFAVKAAVTLLLAHALYKGALFLVAGAVEHEAGTRQVPQLAGLGLRMPWTSLTAGLGALSMAGLPPFLGFISKELVYEAVLTIGWPLASVTALALALGVCVALVVGAAPFWTKRKHVSRPGHEAPPSMTFGPLILAALGLLAGLVPGPIARVVVGPAVGAAFGQPVSLGLALWHGFTPSLALSCLTVIAGVLIYSRWEAARLRLEHALPAWGPERGYTSGMVFLVAFARWLTRLLQSGHLRRYMRIIVLTTVAAGAYALFRARGFHWPEQDQEPRFFEIGVALLILAAALTSVVSRSRLGAVAALGAVGYGVALIYLIFGAPDLAMTQFLIESLTVILFVLAFYHLPRFAHLTSRRERLRDAIIALAAGALMTALVLSAVGVQFHPSISSYYLESAESLAHARNIVNAILVDFRGIDTLGEIVVLAISAIGVFALLKLGKPRRPERPGLPAGNPSERGGTQ